VDFVDLAFAPGTGTPEIGGFTSREAQEFVRGLAGIELVGCDVVEVYPSYDGPGQVTALLAANVVYELLTLIAIRGGTRS
jgi:agmatinase